MGNKRKISSYIINPDFQGKFLAIFMIFALFQAFVNYYVVYFSFKQIRTTIEKMAPPSIPETGELLEMVSLQEFYVITLMGFAYVMSFLVFAVVGVRFTHSAAGALYRIKSEFIDMAAKKNLHYITLRKGDFFRDVEASFNDLVDKVGKNKDN